MIGCDSLGPLSSSRLLVRVAIFFFLARSQRLVLASLKRSLHLWHPRVQKNSLAFQATAGEYALRPAQGTRAGGLMSSGGDRKARARLPGAPSSCPGPQPRGGTRDRGESSGCVWATAGHSQGGYSCKELICPCLLTRVGRKGGSAPLNSQLLRTVPQVAR